MSLQGRNLGLLWWLAIVVTGFVSSTVPIILMSPYVSLLGSILKVAVVDGGDGYKIVAEFTNFFASLANESHLAIHDPYVLEQTKGHNLEVLKSQYQAILEEYNQFRSNHIIPNFAELDRNQKGLGGGNWQTLWLRLYGTESCLATDDRFFPKTMAIVRQSGLPAVSVMLSRLGPGQLLEPHIGPTSAILRYHLGISIPTNNLTTDPSSEARDEASWRPPYLTIWPCNPSPEFDIFRCPREKLHWKNGESIYFDDSYYHSANNPTQEERVVLWLDLQRHDLKGWKERLISNIVFWMIKQFPPTAIRNNIEKTNRLCVDSHI